MYIQRFSAADETPLFAMLKEEGDSWRDYHGEHGRARYLRALQASITYLLYAENELCGYVRCHEDYGFGVYIHDLLVRKQFRGRQYGRLLMEQVCKDFPHQ